MNLVIYILLIKKKGGKKHKKVNNCSVAFALVLSLSTVSFAAGKSKAKRYTLLE